MTSSYYSTWENQGLRKPEPPQELRDWANSIGLNPFEDYLINPKVHHLILGLGWDEGVDVDASAALFSQNHKLLDSVWWHQLTSKDGSVKHSGDDRTGEGGGDDERIHINLDELPSEVHHVLLAICIYSRGFSFSQVRRAYVRLILGKPKYNGHVLCSFSLSEMKGNAMIMGLISRRGAYWNFRALGMSATGRTIHELVQDKANLECLEMSPSWSPVLRRIQVLVVKGENLAPKDDPGLFGGESSSDPYYIIKFKNKKAISKHVSKSLNPEWKAMIFDMGFITEAEHKGLQIEVYDYDSISADDFMGCIWIPGSALYNHGVGKHDLWLTLGPSKEARHRKEFVSGRIHLEIRVTE
eukprot:g6215.t1